MLPSNPKIFSNIETFSVFLYLIHFESTEIDEQPGHRGWITTQSCLKVMCIRHKHTCARTHVRAPTHTCAFWLRSFSFLSFYCPSLFIPFPQSCSLSAYRFSLFPPLSSLPPLLLSRFLSSSSLHAPPSLFSLPPASKDAISVAELEGTCLMRWNNITHPRPLVVVRVFLDQNMHSTSKARTFSGSQDVSAVPYKCEGLFEC